MPAHVPAGEGWIVTACQATGDQLVALGAHAEVREARLLAM